MSGQQNFLTVAGKGVFQLQADNTVKFTPVSGYAGTVKISYTVQDSRGRVSNAASIAVTVQPDPNGKLMLFSFEDGPAGWGPGSW